MRKSSHDKPDLVVRLAITRKATAKMARVLSIVDSAYILPCDSSTANMDDMSRFFTGVMANAQRSEEVMFRK